MRLSLAMPIFIGCSAIHADQAFPLSSLVRRQGFLVFFRAVRLPCTDNRRTNHHHAVLAVKIEWAIFPKPRTVEAV